MKRPHPAMRRRKSEPQRSAVVIYLIVHKYFLFFCLLKKKEKEKKNSSLLNSINRQVHVSSIIPHSTDADEYKLTWLTPKEPDESLNDLITILIVALLKVSNKAIIIHALVSSGLWSSRIPCGNSRLNDRDCRLTSNSVSKQFTVRCFNYLVFINSRPVVQQTT